MEEETVACRAKISALGALDRQFLDLKSGKLSLKKLEYELLLNARSASHKTPARNSIVSPQQLPAVYSESL